MALFNPSSRAMMLEDYLVFHPLNGSTLLAPVILPVSTVRAALKRAQANNETYVVDVTAALEAHPSAVVRLSSDGSCHHVVNGKIRDACSSAAVVAGDDSHDNKQVVHWLWAKNPQTNTPSSSSFSWFWQPIVDKLLVPYPEMVGLDEEICMT
jgi:hypothetical protein